MHTVHAKSAESSQGSGFLSSDWGTVSDIFFGFGTGFGFGFRCGCRFGYGVRGQGVLLRGTILNRTYGTHANLCISLFLTTIFGSIYYGPP